jgi:hypothetical protein
MATILNIATPMPALTLDSGSTAAAVPVNNFLFAGFAVTMANGPPTAYDLNSVSLTAGTWVVVGLAGTTTATTTVVPYLSSSSAVNSSSWPTKTSGTGISPATISIAAVVKLTSTTTVYLNATNNAEPGTGYGALYAVQIG